MDLLPQCSGLHQAWTATKENFEGGTCDSGKKFVELVQCELIDIHCCWHCASDPRTRWENLTHSYHIFDAPTPLRRQMLKIPGSSEETLSCPKHSAFSLLRCFLHLPTYALAVATSFSSTDIFWPFALQMKADGTFVSTVKLRNTFAGIGLFLSSPYYPRSQELFQVERLQRFRGLELVKFDREHRLQPDSWNMKEVLAGKPFHTTSGLREVIESFFLSNYLENGFSSCFRLLLKKKGNSTEEHHSSGPPELESQETGSSESGASSVSTVSISPFPEAEMQDPMEVLGLPNITDQNLNLSISVSDALQQGRLASMEDRSTTSVPLLFYSKRRLLSVPGYTQASSKLHDMKKGCSQMAEEVIIIQQGFTFDPVPVYAIFPSGVIARMLSGDAALGKLFKKALTNGSGRSLLSREVRTVTEKLAWYLLYSRLCNASSKVSGTYTPIHPACCAIPSAQNNVMHNHVSGISSAESGVTVEKGVISLAFSFLCRESCALEQFSNVAEQNLVMDYSTRRSDYHVPDAIMQNFRGGRDVRQVLTSDIGSASTLTYFRETEWSDENVMPGLISLESDESRRGEAALPNAETNKDALSRGRLVLEDLLLLAPTVLRAQRHGMKREMRSEA